MNSYVTWNAYEFGIDTTLDQWDYKWGHYSMELELEVTVEAITSTDYSFKQFDITIETDVAFVRLKQQQKRLALLASLAYMSAVCSRDFAEVSTRERETKMEETVEKRWE